MIKPLLYISDKSIFGLLDISTMLLVLLTLIDHVPLLLGSVLLFDVFQLRCEIGDLILKVVLFLLKLLELRLKLSVLSLSVLDQHFDVLQDTVFLYT